MIKNLLASAAFLGLVASCTSPAPIIPPATPTIIYGCTQQLVLPTCAPSTEMPFYQEGDSAVEVAEGYETLKGRIQQLEICNAKIKQAALAYREVCRGQE